MMDGFETYTPEMWLDGPLSVHVKMAAHVVGKGARHVVRGGRWVSRSIAGVAVAVAAVVSTSTLIAQPARATPVQFALDWGATEAGPEAILAATVSSKQLVDLLWARIQSAERVAPQSLDDDPPFIF
jgi:hypothetical protein